MPRRKTYCPQMSYRINTTNNNSNSNISSQKLSNSKDAQRLLLPHLRRKREIELQQRQQQQQARHISNNTFSPLTNRNRKDLVKICGIILLFSIVLVLCLHPGGTGGLHDGSIISLNRIFVHHSTPESVQSKHKMRNQDSDYNILQQQDGISNSIRGQLQQQQIYMNNNNDGSSLFINQKSQTNDEELNESVSVNIKPRSTITTPNTSPEEVITTTIKQEQEQPTTEQEEKEEYNNIKPAIQASTNDINKAPKIAYVVPILECPILYQETVQKKPDQELALKDVLAILKHSIHRMSIHNTRSKYNYEMIALLHKDNPLKCYGQDYIPMLQSLGYKIQIVGTPISLDAVKGMYLKGNIVHTRHGAEKDWAKLNVYKFTDYPLVVLVDIRTLFLQPLDELFDIMLQTQEDSSTSSNIQDVWDGNVIPLGYNHHHQKQNIHQPSSEINAMYTKSYIDVKPINNNWMPGIHLTMLILKPDTTVFNDLLNIIRDGDFRFFVGWAGKGYANFEGAMQSRGLITYFYDYLHPTTSLELNRCIYHNTADIPHAKHESKMICRENRNISSTSCTDCRETPLPSIKVFHYGACSDPWKCFIHSDVLGKLKLCRKMHHYWYRLRDELETSWEFTGGSGYRKKKRDGTYFDNQFLGSCTKSGYDGYIPMNHQV